MENNTLYLQKTSKKDDRFLVFFLVIACLSSNLSQLPVIVSASMTQAFNMPGWIILLLYCVVSQKFKVSTSIFYLLSTLVGVMILSSIFFIINGNDYFGSSIFSSLLISLLICCLGNFSGSYLQKKDLKRICLVYVISTLVISCAVYLESFSGGIDLASRVYAYASKNSISQIIFTAIIILMFIQFPKIKIYNLFRIFSVSFLVILMAVLKSRATLLGFIICLIYLLVSRKNNRKLKFLLGFFIVGFGILLLVNENFSSLILDNIVFAGRDVSDTDELSSGRLSILASFPDLIEGNIFTGIGAIYFECFPLSAILNFGLLGGILVIGIAYSPLISAYRWRNNNEYTEMFFLICLGYIINSFFEGLAPVGPGAKCYFMWLMFGILGKMEMKEVVARPQYAIK